MASFGILHLTDLHYGLKSQKIFLPGVLAGFYRDLEILHRHCGPWDLVLFSGDLVQSGTQAQFEALQQFLDELWQRLRLYGSLDPLLLAVPGNHDLVRPKNNSLPLLTLQELATSSNRELVWDDILRQEPAGPCRKVIDKAFKAYNTWWEKCPYRGQNRTDVTYHPGPLPGDFAAVLEKESVRLGVVGLNTTFLQLTDHNYEGRLALDARQFNEACEGKGPLWFENNIDACILMTHQPPNWLAPSNRATMFNGEIDTAGRFAAHFCGHMHVSEAETHGMGWASERRLIRGGSLFGLETSTDGTKTDRIHAYAACRIELPEEVTQGSIRLWPRLATRVTNALEFDRDTAYRRDSLKNDEGTKAQEFERLRKSPVLDPPPIFPVNPRKPL